MFLASFGTFIWWIVVGLVAGALARFLLPGRQKMNIIFTILLGVAGAYVGGYLANHFKIGGESALIQILIATGGALILLILGSLIMKLKK